MGTLIGDPLFQGPPSRLVSNSITRSWLLRLRIAVEWRAGAAKCFSVQADIVGGLAVSAVGIDVLRRVGQRRNHFALAALPLLFGLHQLDEVFVWLSLQGHISYSVGRAATWNYLLFALVLLSTYIPFAVRQIEQRARRRAMMNVFQPVGVAVSATLLCALIRGPVRAELALNHLGYTSGLHAGWPIVDAYVLATCGSLLVSSVSVIAAFGVINMVAVAGLAYTVVDGLATLWCFWAAIARAAFAVYLRYGLPPQQQRAPEALQRRGAVDVRSGVGVTLRTQVDDDRVLESGEPGRNPSPG